MESFVQPVVIGPWARQSLLGGGLVQSVSPARDRLRGEGTYGGTVDNKDAANDMFFFLEPNEWRGT